MLLMIVYLGMFEIWSRLFSSQASPVGHRVVGADRKHHREQCHANRRPAMTQNAKHPHPNPHADAGRHANGRVRTRARVAAALVRADGAVEARAYPPYRAAGDQSGDGGGGGGASDANSPAP